jgi:hypothetical protein
VSDIDMTAPGATPITVERLENAIQVVADVMVKHDRRGLKVTLERLEAERDRLRHEVDPIEYAKQILARNRAA